MAATGLVTDLRGGPTNGDQLTVLGDTGLVMGQTKSLLGEEDGEPRFNPIQLWLMFFQAGYEPW